ncbi:MAG TPA: PPOX class F420-dependent oxidoreductase [Chloroflexota bacterium]|nr:PPOX class F420-dependent oxidoreductase [Chloroflexota bacterium]
MATTSVRAPDASSPPTVGEDGWAASLAGIERAHYLSLTTFRRGGAPVMTPVWFARVGQALYVITDDDTGKVKRIKNDPAVRVAPSTARGEPIGDTVPARARVLPVTEASPGMRALSAKYRWLFTAFALMHRLQRKTPVLLEIVGQATLRE